MQTVLIWTWVAKSISYDALDVWNVEYLFVAITPRSISTNSSSICYLWVK